MSNTVCRTNWYSLKIGAKLFNILWSLSQPQTKCQSSYPSQFDALTISLSPGIVFVNESRVIVSCWSSWRSGIHCFVITQTEGHVDDDDNDDFTTAWQSIFNWKTASRDSSSAARILRLQSLKVRSSSLSLFILLSFSSFCNFTTNREEPSSSYSSLLSLIRSWFLLLSTEKGWKLLSALMT